MNNQKRARQIIDELRQHKIVKLVRPATPAHIDSAQQELQLLLPDLYKQILVITGEVRIYKRSMFGLGPSAERWGAYKGITMTEFTTMARQKGNIRLPPHLVVIWHNSHQDYQCLDTSRVVDGDCPIVLFDPEIAATDGQEPKLVAANIADWLRDRVQEQLKIKLDWDEYVKTRGRRSAKTSRKKEKRVRRKASSRATPRNAAPKARRKKAKSRRAR